MTRSKPKKSKRKVQSDRIGARMAREARTAGARCRIKAEESAWDRYMDGYDTNEVFAFAVGSRRCEVDPAMSFTDDFGKDSQEDDPHVEVLIFDLKEAADYLGTGFTVCSLRMLRRLERRLI